MLNLPRKAFPYSKRHPKLSIGNPNYSDKLSVVDPMNGPLTPVSPMSPVSPSPGIKDNHTGLKFKYSNESDKIPIPIPIKIKMSQTSDSISQDGSNKNLNKDLIKDLNGNSIENNKKDKTEESNIQPQLSETTQQHEASSISSSSTSISMNKNQSSLPNKTAYNQNNRSRSRRNSFVMKDYLEKKEKEKETLFLKEKGYVKIKDITITLQGIISRYEDINHPTKHQVVIKVTNKELHKKGIVKRDGMILNVQENILKEKNLNIIMHKKNPPKEFVKYIDFFEHDNKYYLINEYGGQDLFQWVVTNHQRINNKKLSLKKWRDHVRISFAQMCRFLEWLHYDMHVCHLDISLENCLIKNSWYDEVNMDVNKNKCQIKFCDFGVAEMFLFDSFKCKKFVGKKGYKAPEIVSKKEFNARKADVWSLGVILFCCLIGAPPFKVAHKSDDNFSAVISGKLKYLLTEYGRLKYMSKFAFDLLSKIFVYEKHRLTMRDISQHPYVKDVLKAHELHMKF